MKVAQAVRGTLPLQDFKNIDFERFGEIDTPPTVQLQKIEISLLRIKFPSKFRKYKHR